MHTLMHTYTLTDVHTSHRGYCLFVMATTGSLKPFSNLTSSDAQKHILSYGKHDMVNPINVCERYFRSNYVEKK